MSNVSFSGTSTPVLCPNTVVEFECVGTNLELLQWCYNDTVLVDYSFDRNGQLQESFTSNPLPQGFNVSLFSASGNFDPSQQLGNITLMLSIELSSFNSNLECIRDINQNQSVDASYTLRSKL